MTVMKLCQLFRKFQLSDISLIDYVCIAVVVSYDTNILLLLLPYTDHRQQVEYYVRGNTR
jgi:hypothetical protein